MEGLLLSISQSLKSGNFYSALFLAITMPSICGALESTDGQDKPERYIDWYEKYMPESFLSGLDCYGFRCGLLHLGTGNFRNDPEQTIRRVIFTFQPGINNNRSDEAVQFNGLVFCQSIIDAVRRWMKDVKDNENFLKNSERLITLHPEGLKPYFGGIPVIG